MKKKRYTGSERRKHFRKNLSFGTDIVRVNRISFKRKWDDETGVNIGADGFCCCSFKKLPDISQIGCLLLFPRPFDLKLIEAEARLMWQQPHPFDGTEMWFHGFQFTKLDPTHQHLINRVLKEDPA